MYYNLQAEMARRRIGLDDISRTIGKTKRAARDKMSGRYSFTLNEAKVVRDTYFQGMYLDYLFAEAEEGDPQKVN